MVFGKFSNSIVLVWTTRNNTGLKKDLSTGLTPGPVCAPFTLSVNLVVICSYSALCIVKRSTPFPATGSADMRDITLNEMDTGFLIKWILFPFINSWCSVTSNKQSLLTCSEC